MPEGHVVKGDLVALEADALAAERRRMLVVVSSSARIGLSGSAPICSIHVGTPCPSPAMNLPGWRRASVAISIAAATGRGCGTRPA